MPARWSSSYRSVWMLRKANRGRRRAARGRERQAGRALKAPHEVERQDTELLPRTVGGVLQRRDAGEGEAAFQLAVRLLVVTPSTHEVPEVAAAQLLIGHDRGVFVMPIGGIEQIELEVLARLMVHPRAVDHHAQPAPPWGELHLALEAAHARIDRRPPPIGPDDLAQARPRVERDLD